MKLPIDLNSGVPPYAQIVRLITEMVASGELEPGSLMPPIREMARNNRINPNTIVRAYRELEVAGVVEKRESVGTYVAENPTPLATADSQKAVLGPMDAFLKAARKAGLGIDQMVHLLRQREEQQRREQTDE